MTDNDAVEDFALVISFVTTIQLFDEPHFVAPDSSTTRGDAPFVLFMVGTVGKPRAAAFFAGLLRAGHRIISISYNFKEAILQLCLQHPDVECTAQALRKRIYGAKPYHGIGVSRYASADNTAFMIGL